MVQVRYRSYQVQTNRSSQIEEVEATSLLLCQTLLQQAVPLQGLANNVLSGQTQYVTNVPVALNGNITFAACQQRFCSYLDS